MEKKLDEQKADKVKPEKIKHAIALEYDPADEAPRVIASGRGVLAERILKKAKEERKLILFDDHENLKIFDLPYSSTKKFKKALELGDCYFIKGNECIKIKTPKC